MTVIVDTFGEPALRTGLDALRDQKVWTLEEAQQRLPDLKGLREARMVIVAPSELGPVVLLDMEGRRMTGLNPHVHISIDRHVNLLYLRLAAAHFGWTITRETYAGAHKDRGQLDRLAEGTDGDRQMKILARCTAGGYSSKSVTNLYTFIRSSLLANRQVLTVVIPERAKITWMHDRLGLIDLVQFSPVATPAPTWLKMQSYTGT